MSYQPYEAVVATTPRIIPGTFQCERDGTGLEVEVLPQEYEKSGVVIVRMGNVENSPCYIHKNAARILKEFFAAVEESLQ